MGADRAEKSFTTQGKEKLLMCSLSASMIKKCVHEGHETNGFAYHEWVCLPPNISPGKCLASPWLGENFLIFGFTDYFPLKHVGIKKEKENYFRPAHFFRDLTNFYIENPSLEEEKIKQEHCVFDKHVY